MSFSCMTLALSSSLPSPFPFLCLLSCPLSLPLHRVPCHLLVSPAAPAGVDPDDLSLPFSRLKVRLSKPNTRPAEVPLAAWEARPTQVAVQPFDIY